MRIRRGFDEDSMWIRRHFDVVEIFKISVKLSKIALDYIWLPISSCSVERSFSMYNSLLDSDRQNLSLNSLKKLNMLYYNK